MKLEPLGEPMDTMIRRTAYLSAGMAIALREGLSPNRAESIISKMIPEYMGPEVGDMMAAFLREYVLPEVTQATADADKWLREAKQ